MIDELSHPYRMELLQHKGKKSYLEQINVDIARALSRLQFRIDEAEQNGFTVVCSIEQTTKPYLSVSVLDQG